MTSQTPNTEQSVVVTRVLHAPPEDVFQAWIDPDRIASWFGPEGFDVPRDRVDIDARSGGHIHLAMVGPAGGMEFPLRYEIVERNAPGLLVLRSEPMPQMGLDHATITRIELQREGDGTRVTIVDGPFPAAGAGGAAAGWEAALTKLEQAIGRTD